LRLATISPDDHFLRIWVYKPSRGDELEEIESESKKIPGVTDVAWLKGIG
jgi:hypothetical protein